MRRQEFSPVTSAATALSLVTLSALIVISSCGPSDPAAAREARAERSDGDIVVGVAWPWATRTAGLYAEGLEMAVEEINAAGGVTGRPLRLVRGDDGESVDGGRLVAQRFADDPDVVAVIGHLNSHISIPAADIYERAGIIMLTPASTAPELTRRGHRLVFRTVHDDLDVGIQMAGLASEEDWGRVFVVYVRTAYGEGLANAFETAAVEAGVRIVGRASYGSDGTTFDGVLDRVMAAHAARGVDAVFLAGVPPEAGRILATLRRGGFGGPVFGGEALDTVELLESAKGAAEGVFVASVFHPDDPRSEPRVFREAFEARFGRTPDSWAARGYEAVRVLADAIEAAGSSTPGRIATAFREHSGVAGVTGSFRFDEKGDVVGKRLVTAVVRDGRFEYRASHVVAAPEAVDVPTLPANTSAP